MHQMVQGIALNRFTRRNHISKANLLVNLAKIGTLTLTYSRCQQERGSAEVTMAVQSQIQRWLSEVLTNKSWSGEYDLTFAIQRGGVMWRVAKKL